MSNIIFYHFTNDLYTPLLFLFTNFASENRMILHFNVKKPLLQIVL